MTREFRRDNQSLLISKIKRRIYKSKYFMSLKERICSRSDTGELCSDILLDGQLCTTAYLFFTECQKKKHGIT